MRRKGETSEFAGRGIGNEGPSATPEATRVSGNEEWAWMVDEDPAFYLSKTGRAESTRG